MDPEFFVLLFVGLIGLSFLGFVLRLVFIILAVVATVRQYQQILDRVARNAPAPGVTPSPNWIADVGVLNRQWTQMNELQRARFDNRQAEMMGITARAGISWPPR